MDIFGQIGKDITGAVQGVGNAIGNFTRPVANFLDQANQQNNRVPIAPQQQAQSPDISGMLKPVGQFVQNTVQNPIFRQQTNPIAAIPGGGDQIGLEAAAKLPTFQIPGVSQFEQGVSGLFGGGQQGQIAANVAGFLPNLAEGMINAPQQYAQGASNFSQGWNQGNLTAPRAIGDVAQMGNAVATLATPFTGGGIMKELATDGWRQGLVKGLINGVSMGGAFGLGQGLQDNKNATNIQSQLQQSLPDVITGMATGGILGSVLGPAGKIFFGNKTPGDAAALATNGLVPPETMKDAHAILGTNPNASLDDIRNAYLQAVGEFHPKNGGTDEAMTALDNAYEMVTGNTAPTFTSDQNNNPVPLWTNDFGGNTLSQQQIAAARKGAVDNTAFQARIEQLKQGNLPVRDPSRPANEVPAGQPTADQFLEKGGDMLSPEGNSQVVAKIQQAAQNQPEFHGILDTVAQQLQGRAMSSVKSPNTMIQKAVAHRVAGDTKYGIDDVGDALRGAVVVGDESKIPQAVQAITQQAQSKGWKVTNTQDFFTNQGETGYKGYHLDLLGPDGQKAEVQLHTPSTWASARLTHPAYAKYDDKIPADIQRTVTSLQNTIDNNTPAQNDALARQDEVRTANQILSPKESDYSNFSDTNPDRELATNKLMQQGQRQAKALGARQVGEQPQTSPNQIRIGQIQNELGQQPQGPTYQEAMGIPTEGRIPITPNNLTRPVQEPGAQTASPKLQALTRSRDILRTQQTSQTTPEMQGLIQMRNGLQQDLNAAQQVLKTKPQNTAALRDHVSNLRDQIAKVDLSVKDMTGKLKVQNKETTDSTRAQLKTLDGQITDEQSRLGVQQTIENEKVRIGQPKPGEETANQKAFATGEPLEDVQKEKIGLPTLSTPEKLIQDKRANPEITTTPYKPTKGLPALFKTLVQPLSGALQRSKDVRARQLAFGVKDAMDYAHATENEYLTKLEIARQKLAPEDYSHAIDVLEGNAQPRNQAVTNWVKTAKGVYKQMLTNAQASGIPVGELQNYFTHSYTKQQIEQMSHDPDVLNGIIAAGKATNSAEASTWLRANTRQLNANEFGSLHLHRYDTKGKYAYIKDPRIVEDYVRHAAHETGFTSVFGENMGKANQLINAMQADGNTYDASAAKQLLDTVGATYGSGKDPGTTAFENITRGINNIETMSKLQLLTTALHHIPATGQMAARLGTRNTIRALPAGVRALFGNYSDSDRLNINRLHETNTSQLYGQPSGILEKTKFYTGIGLNKAITSLSAVANKAAQYRINDIEKDLQTGNPSVRTIRDIQSAGLPYNDILSKGKFTPQQKAAYVTAALKDSSLYLSAEDMPKFYGSTFGHLLGQFAGPTYQRTARLYPYIAKEVMTGRINPLLGLMVMGTAGGIISQEASNFVQNKPAGTPQQTLLQGALRGVAPFGGEQVANAIMYPEFMGSELAGIGGPTASDTVNAQQIYNDFQGQGATPATQKAGTRQLVRNIPLIGVPIANTFFAPKSYLGNRPSDLLGLTNGGQNQAGVQHTPLDFIRQNPQVAQQQAQLNQRITAQNSIIGKLSSADQATYKGLSALEAKAYGSTQDPTALKQYRDTLSNPNIWNTKAQIEKLQAQQDGRRVDPLYLLNSDQGKTYLSYQGMSSADKAKYAETDPSVVGVDRARNTYYQSPDYAKYQRGLAQGIQGYKAHQPIDNPIYAAFPDGNNSYQTAFGTASANGNQQVADYHYWKSLPSGTAKAQFAANHPYVYDGAITEAPYNQSILQQAWDNRPAGQTPQQFYVAQSKGGFTPNFAGIDNNGKIIQAYNPVGDPIYQADPKLRSAALAYTAFNDAKNVAAKRAILAQNPQLINLWSARNTYYQNNPQAANPLDPTQSGIGLDFSTSGGSGSGGSSGYSSYGSSSSLQSTMNYMLKYGMHPSPPTNPKMNLKNPFGQSQQTTVALKANPLKQYYAQQPQQLAKLLASMPKATAQGAKSGLPALKLPKVGAKLNFSLKPEVPQSMNERTVAGRVPTGTAALR